MFTVPGVTAVMTMHFNARTEARRRCSTPRASGTQSIWTFSRSACPMPVQTRSTVGRTSSMLHHQLFSRVVSTKTLPSLDTGLLHHPARSVAPGESRLHGRVEDLQGLVDVAVGHDERR